MTLDQYFETTGTTAAEFGAAIKVSGASVSRIRKGEQNITLDLARDIVNATGGAVSIFDLLQMRKTPSQDIAA